MSSAQKRSRPKGKRGRPALKIQKINDPLNLSNSLHSVLENYETSKVAYECSLFTQQLCLMLQRMAVSPSLSAFTKEPLYQWLEKAVKEVMLTELEVALWSLVLERTEAECRGTDLRLYFRLSAFAVRRVTEGEVMLSDVEAYLDTKPGFQRSFRKWLELHKDKLDIPLLEVNQQFEHLTQPIGPHDCNPYLYALLIDEIIDEPFAGNDHPGEQDAGEREPPNSALGMPRRVGEGPGQLPELSGMPAYEPLEGFEPFRDFHGPKSEED